MQSQFFLSAKGEMCSLPIKCISFQYFNVLRNPNLPPALKANIQHLNDDYYLSGLIINLVQDFLSLFTALITFLKL